MGAGQGPEVLAEALIQQQEEGLDVRCGAAQELPGITNPSALVGATESDCRAALVTLGALV